MAARSQAILSRTRDAERSAALAHRSLEDARRLSGLAWAQPRLVARHASLGRRVFLVKPLTREAGDDVLDQGFAARGANCINNPVPADDFRLVFAAAALDIFFFESALRVGHLPDAHRWR